MHVRTIGATSGRPRRLASANHEPPDPTEEVPEEKLGISLDICGAQIQAPTATKPPTKSQDEGENLTDQFSNSLC
jgi:hypothetical protein